MLREVAGIEKLDLRVSGDIEQWVVTTREEDLIQFEIDDPGKRPGLRYLGTAEGLTYGIVPTRGGSAEKELLEVVRWVATTSRLIDDRHRAATLLTEAQALVRRADERLGVAGWERPPDVDTQFETLAKWLRDAAEHPDHIVSGAKLMPDWRTHDPHHPARPVWVGAPREPEVTALQAIATMLAAARNLPGAGGAGGNAAFGVARWLQAEPGSRWFTNGGRKLAGPNRRRFNREFGAVEAQGRAAPTARPSAWDDAGNGLDDPWLALRLEAAPFEKAVGARFIGTEWRNDLVGPAAAVLLELSDGSTLSVRVRQVRYPGRATSPGEPYVDVPEVVGDSPRAELVNYVTSRVRDIVRAAERLIAAGIDPRDYRALDAAQDGAQPELNAQAALLSTVAGGLTETPSVRLVEVRGHTVTVTLTRNRRLTAYVHFDAAGNPVVEPSLPISGGPRVVIHVDPNRAPQRAAADVAAELARVIERMDILWDAHELVQYTPYLFRSTQDVFAEPPDRRGLPARGLIDQESNRDLRERLRALRFYDRAARHPNAGQAEALIAGIGPEGDPDLVEMFDQARWVRGRARRLIEGSERAASQPHVAARAVLVRLDRLWPNHPGYPEAQQALDIGATVAAVQTAATLVATLGSGWTDDVNPVTREQVEREIGRLLTDLGFDGPLVDHQAWESLPPDLQAFVATYAPDSPAATATLDRTETPDPGPELDAMSVESIEHVAPDLVRLHVRTPANWPAAVIVRLTDRPASGPHYGDEGWLITLDRRASIDAARRHVTVALIELGRRVDELAKDNITPNEREMFRRAIERGQPRASWLGRPRPALVVSDLTLPADQAHQAELDRLVDAADLRDASPIERLLALMNDDALLGALNARWAPEDPAGRSANSVLADHAAYAAVMLNQWRVAPSIGAPPGTLDLGRDAAFTPPSGPAWVEVTNGAAWQLLAGGETSVDEATLQDGYRAARQVLLDRLDEDYDLLWGRFIAWQADGTGHVTSVVAFEDPRWPGERGVVHLDATAGVVIGAPLTRDVQAVDVMIVDQLGEPVVMPDRPAGFGSHWEAPPPAYLLEGPTWMRRPSSTLWTPDGRVG
jgi:hypothetical protein